jgi:lysophospholipase L1-like esterase
MATRKKATTKKRGSRRSPEDRTLEAARAQAGEVLAVRRRALRSRVSALRARDALGAERDMAVEPALLRAMGGARSAGVLVAEGDSWFDYPWTDVLGELEDAYGYDVESVARAGDRVEDMAYHDGQLANFTRAIEKVVRRGSVPRAILLSGGGNDVAGREFATLLNHAQSTTPGLNDAIVRGIVDERIRLAYVRILGAVTSVCEQLLGRRVPIVVHGYDYPVPDGRGFLGGWWLLPGPWMEPGFRAKGYGVLADRVRIAAELIDRFNAMLRGVAALSAFPHVKYVDLRRTLSTGSDYKRWWENELHPTIRGFGAVTKKIASAL